MKPTLLEELWNGQITPYKHVEQNDPEVAELAELVERNRASLEEALNEEQKKLLEKFLRCQIDYDYLLIIHAFRMGFSLAGRLLGEAMSVEI